jgi:hypothetical protein
MIFIEAYFAERNRLAITIRPLTGRHPEKKAPPGKRLANRNVFPKGFLIGIVRNSGLHGVPDFKDQRVKETVCPARIGRPSDPRRIRTSRFSR